jgi:hypothetical protein
LIALRGRRQRIIADASAVPVSEPANVRDVPTTEIDPVEFFRERLSGGPRPINELQAAAETAGLTKRQIRYALDDKLGTVPCQRDGRWWRVLPTPSPRP